MSKYWSLEAGTRLVIPAHSTSGMALEDLSSVGEVWSTRTQGGCTGQQLPPRRQPHLLLFLQKVANTLTVRGDLCCKRVLQLFGIYSTLYSSLTLWSDEK